MIGIRRCLEEWVREMVCGYSSSPVCMNVYLTVSCWICEAALDGDNGSGKKSFHCESVQIMLAYLRLGS
jgi:hypothetical protein